MDQSKVSPELQADDADRILSSSRLEDQEKRHEIFLGRYASCPHQNVWDAFMAGVQISASQPCLGSRTDATAPYTWVSYQEVTSQARSIGAFLTGVLGLRLGSFVAVWSKNRAEWVTLELGCFLHGLVPVPLYDTLGEEACDHALRQTGATVMLCEGPAQVEGLAKLKCCSQVQHLIQLTQSASDGPARVWGWTEALQAGCDCLQQQGRQTSGDARPPGREDLAILCYTSGTTGLPKGVQITHGNLLSEVLGMHEFLVAQEGGKQIVFNPDDVYLSYLPLAHIFERIMQLYCFSRGVRIGFYRGDILTLTADMRELRPTVFCTVPRLLNRIHDAAFAGVSDNCLKSFLFNLALKFKSEEVDRGIIRSDSVWDSLVFSKVREPTGDRIRLVVVGSAPLAEAVMRFSRAAFGCPVLEGYGQSEACGASTCTPPSCVSTGHVGMPMFQNLVQLQDAPDLGYFARDGRGEICVRGTNVTSGYYDQPDKTAEAIDSGGWLHTGDIGEWTPDGWLRIIDRKKHLFKLAQGEYLAPEKIEQVYAACASVEQVFVDGDSLESCALAVVVPFQQAAIAWAKRNQSLPTASTVKPEEAAAAAAAAACASEEFKREVMQEMLAAGRAAGLKSFEQVKDIHLHAEVFSIANGLLTPTFKAKRPELKKLFAADFRRMYQKLRTGA